MAALLSILLCGWYLFLVRVSCSWTRLVCVPVLLPWHRTARSLWNPFHDRSRLLTNSLRNLLMCDWSSLSLLPSATVPELRIRSQKNQSIVARASQEGVQIDPSAESQRSLSVTLSLSQSQSVNLCALICTVDCAGYGCSVCCECWWVLLKFILLSHALPTVCCATERLPHKRHPNPDRDLRVHPQLPAVVLAPDPQLILSGDRHGVLVAGGHRPHAPRAVSDERLEQRRDHGVVSFVSADAFILAAHPKHPIGVDHQRVVCGAKDFHHLWSAWFIIKECVKQKMTRKQKE